MKFRIARPALAIGLVLLFIAPTAQAQFWRKRRSTTAPQPAPAPAPSPVPGLPLPISIPGLGGSLSNADIIAGLRQALEVGTTNGTARLGRTDGFLKDALLRIALPPEAQYAAQTVERYGGSTGRRLVQDVVERMNRAAEAAAANPQTREIFLNAIRNITISDGLTILRGDSVAATSYLRGQTFTPLRDLFAPVVRQHMQQAGVDQAWSRLSQLYNTYSRFVPRAQPVPTDISNYVTERALSGVFTAVGQEEAKIRRDPAARITDILRRVFQ